MSYLNVASGDVVAALPGEAKAGFIRRTGAFFIHCVDVLVHGSNANVFR